MAQYYTDFSGHTAGNTLQTHPDWTIRYDNPDNSYWYIKQDSAKEGGKYAEGVPDGWKGPEEALYSWDVENTVSDAEMYARVTRDPGDSAGGLYLRHADQGGDTSYYLGWESDNEVLEINKNFDTTIASTSNTDTPPYNLRFRVNGTDLYGKIWDVGATEPSSWTVTASDSEYSSGFAGLGTHYVAQFDVDVVSLGTNGDSAPTEPNVIDSFEDGDISEYSGETNSFQVSTNETYDGSNSLRPSGAFNATIYRTDVSISTGDTPFGAWVNPGIAELQSFNSELRFHFGILFGAPNGQDDGFAATIDAEEGAFALRRNDSDGSTILASSSSQSLSAVKWYNIEVTTWDSNGNITVSLKDTSGGEIESLSATDTTFTSENVGWYCSTGGDSVVVFPYGDLYYKPESGGGTSPPSAPTNLNATVQ